MHSPLRFHSEPSVDYASSDLFTIGSEDRRPDHPGWGDEQNAGDRPAIAFSLRPVKVEFEGADPVLLAPTTLAMTRPGGGYTRDVRCDAGQRTLFLVMSPQTACGLAGVHNPGAREREGDPFPGRYGPCCVRAHSMACQLGRAVFDAERPIEALGFDEMAMQIVEHALAGVGASSVCPRPPDGPSAAGWTMRSPCCAPIPPGAGRWRSWAMRWSSRRATCRVCSVPTRGTRSRSR